MPNALLIYPEFPPSYWSAKYALEFIGRKASMPPLGLLTIAAMFPEKYQLKIVDMNVESLRDEDLAWADYAFISAMIVQRESFHQVAQRCKARGLKVIVGGPYPTSYADSIADVDYIVRGEVESFFAQFLEQLEAGTAQGLTEAAHDAKGQALRPEIGSSPVPRYDLLDLNQYGAVAIQFSRGCPFECEFCDITALFGRVPRTKSNPQVLAELQNLYDCGWRGSVFFVDDNFIGNKARARDLLPAIRAWQEAHNFPFFFYTEASVNLAGMGELMDAMAAAGFDMVFLGLETPNPKALLQIGKGQNVKKDQPDYLLNAVRTIQQHGLEVTAGFIIGLDGDERTGFEAQLEFVQKAGIPTAMVGLLTALKGTRLYERYQREGRLLQESNGNNVSVALNFVPLLPAAELIEGYKHVLSSLYDRSLRNYFERCYTLLEHWQRKLPSGRSTSLIELKAFVKSVWRQGLSRQGPAYFRFLGRVLLHRPKMLPEAVRLAIMGYHYERVTRQQLLIDELRSYLEQQYCLLQDFLSKRVGTLAERSSQQVHEARAMFEQRMYECSTAIALRYAVIHRDFRLLVDQTLETFQASLETLREEYLPTAELRLATQR